MRQAQNRGQGLIVSGCLPQRFRDQLPKLLPEVDAFMGIDQVANVTDIVRQALVRRAEKTRSGKAQPGRKRKQTLAGNLAGLDRQLGPEAEESQSLRGTANFGKTRTVVGVPAPPPIPLIDVNLRPTYIPDYGTPRFRLTPKHFAYIKIAEGCNHPCSFCIIPRMRGSHRSRQQADVVAEARALLADGVKELNLISQDSTYYGLDLRPHHSRAIASPQKFNAAVHSLGAESSTICTLLRELNALPGNFWIRLLYTHPAHWTDELIQTIAECRKVVRYVDIPLQHIHENMLERMRRETSREYIVDLLRRIRAGVPGITLRTTFIVGFPGETEAAFESLLEFIRETRFERLGVFAYSREDGTRAGSMAGQIPEKVRQQRRERAMAVQHEVATQVAASFVGRTLTVLTESEATARELRKARIQSWEHGLMRDSEQPAKGLKGRYTLCRSQAEAPDIDGRVYVPGKLPLGEFFPVKIVGHTDYDLIGQAEH
ncbi:MAG TPA: 30S ribosomal protein S12 methylthiotransferase RimO [Clostridia bacterium]|nr:30S ribosomal protein S12 methylthiotransferase RimO [Clostridia bacterium]